MERVDPLKLLTERQAEAFVFVSLLTPAGLPGISAKIRNAYSFLSHNYNFRTKEDEIILVGFSRGAFAVQCLASFICQTGLLQKQHLYYLRSLFKLWANQEVGGQSADAAKSGLAKLRDDVAALKEASLLHSARITALAVWDTVNTLGLPVQLPPLALAFVGKKVPKGVDQAFQALALDEARVKFQPCVWQDKEVQSTRLSQCWFRGSHGDVGGNGDASLGAVTLLWMIGQLRDHVRVAFVEAEIAKHLKHQFLEWDIHVSKTRGTFLERRALASLRSSGRKTEVPWYWWLFGRRSRNDYLRGIHCKQGLMEVHFSVRLYMVAHPASSCTLEKWKTEVLERNRVRWCSSDGGQTLHEQELRLGGEEFRLLSKWSRHKFEDPTTDRGRFAKLILLDESGDGLQKFAELLKPHTELRAGQLAPGMMYQGKN